MSACEYTQRVCCNRAEDDLLYLPVLIGIEFVLCSEKDDGRNIFICAAADQSEINDVLCGFKIVSKIILKIIFM